MVRPLFFLPALFFFWVQLRPYTAGSPALEIALTLAGLAGVFSIVVGDARRYP